MSLYKRRDEAVAPVPEPRNWNPVIGGLVVLGLLILLAGLYAVAGTIGPALR